MKIRPTNDEDSCRDSKQLPQSNPLMEEIVFEDDENAPESHHGLPLSSDDNSVMEDEQDEDDKVDNANQVTEETGGTEMDMNEPMDSLLDNDDGRFKSIYQWRRRFRNATRDG